MNKKVIPINLISVNLKWVEHWSSNSKGLNNSTMFDCEKWEVRPLFEYSVLVSITSAKLEEMVNLMFSSYSCLRFLIKIWFTHFVYSNIVNSKSLNSIVYYLWVNDFEFQIIISLNKLFNFKVKRKLAIANIVGKTNYCSLDT